MGKFIEWTDELSVGIEEIDEQHKVLVGLVNEMHEAIHERHGTEAVKSILARLTDYTRIHFAVEESLMRILNYPDYESHLAEHAELQASLAELEEKVASGQKTIGFELMHFLKVWLTKHILHTDKEYTAHFLDAGAHPRLKKTSWVSRLWGSGR